MQIQIDDDEIMGPDEFWDAWQPRDYGVGHIAAIQTKQEFLSDLKRVHRWYVLNALLKDDDPRDD